MTTATIDATDPMVVILTWALTYAFGQATPKLRKALPAVALLLAVGLHAGTAAVAGEPLTLDVLVRAAGAAGVAVLGHSQMREIAKTREKAD